VERGKPKVLASPSIPQNSSEERQSDRRDRHHDHHPPHREPHAEHLHGSIL
jgi:hypothetical protein